MKPIEVGDRVRVNWPGGYYDGLEGRVEERMGDFWVVNIPSHSETVATLESMLVNLTLDTSELQPGFYWVRIDGGWTIGRYNCDPKDDSWYVEWEFLDWDYISGTTPDEIGERIERKETP